MADPRREGDRQRLAAVQSGGNLAASAIAGILYTAVSPEWAFGFLATTMAVALIVVLATPDDRAGSPPPQT